MKTPVVVLGTGSMGTRHLRVLATIAGVESIAIPVRGERRAGLADQGFTVAASLREATKRGAALCIVATDTARHVADALEAIDHGYDVLVEKPLARDAVEADAVRDAARAASRQVFVGCVLRFAESLNRFKEHLPSIAPVHSVRVECQSYLPDWRPERPYRLSYAARADEGGVLRDLIHEIDYAGWLFGWPVAVQARLVNTGRLGIAAEEAAELWWMSTEDSLISVTVDYLTRPTRRRLRACGVGGTLEWDAVAGTVRLARADGTTQEVTSDQTRDHIVGQELRAFIAASTGDRDPRLATCEDGLRALAVCDAARRASDTGRAVVVAYR